MDTVTTTTTTATAPTATAPPPASDLNRRLAMLEARVGMVGGPNQNKKNNTHGDITIPQRLVNIRREYEHKIAAAGAASGETTDGAATATLMLECMNMLQELDPEIALTHQQQPLLYKRQQVLAAASELQQNFHHLDIMLQLLLTGTRPPVPQNNNGSTTAGDGRGDDAAATFGTNSGKASSDPKEGNTNDPHQEQHKLQQKQQKAELARQTRMAGGRGAGNSSSSLRVEEIAQAPILTEYYGTVLQPPQQAKLAAVQHQLLELQHRSTALQTQYHEVLECYNTTMTAVSTKMIRVNEQINVKMNQKEQQQEPQEMQNQN